MTLFDRIFKGSGASQLPIVSPVSWLIENNIVHDAATILQWWKHDSSSKGLLKPIEKQKRSATCYCNKNFKPPSGASKEAIISSHRKRYFHFLGTKLKEDFSNVEFLLDRLIRYSGRRFVFRYLPWDGVSDRFILDSIGEFDLLTFYVIKNGADMNFDFPLDTLRSDYSFPVPQERHEWNPPDDSSLTGFRNRIAKDYPGVAPFLETNLDDLVGRRLRQLSFVYSDAADCPPVIDTLFFPNYSAVLVNGELPVGEMLAVSYTRKIDEEDIQALKEEFIVYNSHFDRAGLRTSVKELELAAEVNRHATAAARAALFSRNFSHNIGSHSLTHPAFARLLSIGEGSTGQVHTQRLHLYLQHRYDWISQMVSGVNTSDGQPMRLLGEVLPSFFQQRALLGTLVEDQGFRQESIRFTVKIGDNSVAYALGGGAPDKVNESDHIGVKLTQEVFGTKDGVQDFIVAVPGGRVGCQALYSIIENVMRNSAKYAKRKEPSAPVKMDIHLSIVPKEDRYQVTIWDAAAGAAKDGTPLDDEETNGQLQRVQHLAGQPLITNTGALAEKGRGLLDMRESARFLAGRLASATPKPLGSELAPTHDTLAHTFCFQRPLLLSLLVPGREKTACASRLELWDTAGSIPEWKTGRRPSLGVIWDDGTQAVEELQNDAAQNHRCLPYRLLVVCAQEEQCAGWTLPGLPRNRIQVICPSSAFWKNANDAAQWLRGVIGSSPTFCGCSGDEAAILRLYEAWLAAAKPSPEGKWKLGVGIERPKAHVADAWSAADSFESSLIDIFVHARQNDVTEVAKTSANPSCSNAWLGVQEAAGRSGYFKSPAWKSWLFFDNHGNCFKPNGGYSLGNLSFDQLPGFFSEIGKGQLSLWNALDAPPKDPFGFAWFVLNLVESAVTRIVVLDERILSYADSPAHEVASPPWRELISANVYPVRKIVSGNGAHEILPLLNQNQGTSLMNDGGVEVTYSNQRDEMAKMMADEWDILLIHESIAEKLVAADKFSDWSKAVSKRAKWLVNTSGRGEGRSELFGVIMPFVGFAAVGESAIVDRNKLNFVNSLIGAEIHE